MKVEYLPWDSEFFQKKIGRIDQNIKEKTQLISVLKESRENGYQLIYLITKENVYLDDNILILYNGKLVDRKIVYSLEFKNDHNNPEEVEEYISSELCEDLEHLAYISGTFSRFLTDNGFAQKDFFRLYRTWIIKSIRKELADKIFIIKDSGRIIGMITLKILISAGEIGLIAISDTKQGKGFGSKLINACKKTLADNNIYTLFVTTQLANKSACLFYEKCGFKKLTIHNIFHLWL